MVPRKEESKSKKYSSLPGDFNELIKQSLNDSEVATLWKGKTLNVSGRIYPEELILKVGLNAEGEIRFQNFSASLDFDGESKNLIEKTQIAMEAISSMMEQFLSSTEEMDMPEDWHSYKFDKEEIYMMFSTENDDLEAKANALLGEDFSDETTEVDNDYLGLDFFKEAEEKFRTNLH